MATGGEDTKAVLDIVKALSLDQFYPEKLTTDDLYKITELSIQETENITQQTICWIFINRLTRNNYKARNLKIEAEANKTKSSGYLHRKRQERLEKLTQFHPLEIIATVYVCCDPLAKQDLVKFMWGCKMAVPFVLNCGISDYPVVYQWPLKALITQWQEDGNAIATEHSIIKYPMQKIGFVRVGDLEESKSALLNGIIGGPEKAHPMFFHRDMHGSQKSRSILVEGFVELGWFFPKGVKTDRFDSCKLFANLRGDASKCSQGFEFLLQTMDLILIISHTRYFVNQIDTFRTAIKHGKKVILILTDKNIEHQNDKIEDLLEHIENFDDESFEILPLEEERLDAKLEFISENIKKMELKFYISLENTICATKLELWIDEISDKTVNKSVQYATSVISGVDIIVKDSDKNVILPLQGDTWKKWTETEVETHNLENFSRGETGGDILSYLDSLEMEKIKLRKQQFDILEKLPHVMLYFIQCIAYLKKGELKVFLRTLQLGLDEISREMHRPYYEQYKIILEDKKNADEQKNNILNEKLEQLDIKKAAVSIGLEHLIRELGQIYEACASQGNPSLDIKLTSKHSIDFMRIPHLAAKILLGGYPIEIMDGDVGFVPEMWIAEVLVSLRQQLGDGNKTRLHIISVLGIQSSGKSTLLNTLFGLQFAVSAGRCTKGVFMQMIKVSESLKSTFNCDYIVAIDTEGLRAAHASTKYDNELSCFSIGLADLTVVNLMGENAKYLEENLPVVVHAFLRMDMAGLKPQCILVHQNVDKTNKEKLMEQTRLLEKVLDELTAKACDIERICPHKRFKDIIHFDVSDSTYYIPALLEGDLPMGPVSIGYSQECNILRNMILKRCERSSRHLTIDEFARHLQNLWSAIKTDHFVFNFKSTAETQSSLQLEDFYTRIHRSLLKAISQLGEKAQENLLIDQKAFCEIKESLKRKTQGAGQEHREKLIKYMDDPNHLYSKMMNQWRDEKLQRLKLDLQEAESDCINQLEKAFSKMLSITQKSNSEGLESEDISNLNELIKAETKKKVGKTEQMIAESVWSKWSAENKKVSKLLELDTSFIKHDVEKVLLELFASERHRIEKTLSKNPRMLADYTLRAFVIKESHIKLKYQLFDALHVTRSKQEVETIAKLIMGRAEKEVTGQKSGTKSTIRRILLDTKTMLCRNKSKLTKEFETDICIHLSSYLINVLSENYVKEETASIQKQKKYIIAVINALIKQKREEAHILCAEEVVGIVLECIIHKTLRNLHRTSISINRLLNKSKQQWIDFLIAEAIKHHDYESIDLYLIDPESAILEMLIGCIHTDELKKEALNEFSRKIQNLQVIIKRCFTNRVTVLELLEEMFARAHLQIPNELQRSVIGLGLDTAETQRQILKGIEAVNRSIWQEVLFQRIENEKERLKKMIAKYFVNKYIGCSERCPFCDEICMYDSPNHVGRHQSARHRPVACKGEVKITSKTIVFEICSTLVRTNVILKEKNRDVPYKDFRKFYPEWEIRGHASSEISLLWKWYFAKHCRWHLEKNCKLVTPSAWDAITEDSVIQSLLTD